MLREKIKTELEQRGWSISKLSEETGIRYPSLTEYLKGNKEIESKNIEIILKTLNLEIMFINKTVIYKELTNQFDGNLPTHEKIPSCEMASYFFGVLVNSAGKYLQNELKGYEMNYGDIYDKFVTKTPFKGVMRLDIPLSCQKREFIRIADTYFNQKEKLLYSKLCGLKYDDSDDREYAETQFICGLFVENRLA